MLTVDNELVIDAPIKRDNLVYKVFEESYHGEITKDSEVEVVLKDDDCYFISCKKSFPLLKQKQYGFSGTNEAETGYDRVHYATYIVN